jgi:sulfate transport system permease protein
MSADEMVSIPPTQKQAGFSDHALGRPRLGNLNAGALLTALVLAWFAFLVLFPLGAIVRGAFREGFTVFLAALSTPEAGHAFRLTLVITVISVIFNVFFGVAMSLVLARQRFPGVTLLSAIVDLPFAVSPVVAGFMFIILFGPDGWLGRWFEAGGIRIVFALPGMILVTMFVTLPFVTREVVPVLMEAGLEQEEAASTLGAGSRRTFRRVTLPTIKWGLSYGIALTTARALGEFGAVLVVSGSIIRRTQTTTLHIHQEFTDFHYEGAFSASLVLAAVSFCMLIAMELMRRRADARRG